MSIARTALVIGGGVAGSATALALRRAGISATVFEARPTGGETTGIMLTLGSNGIDALRAIDADAPVLDLGFETPAIVLRSHTGRLLGRSVVSSTDPTAPASRTMRRADLNRALQEHVASCGIPVERDRRLVRVEQHTDGVVAVFADGSTAEADLLVGADGVRSTVRRQIDQQAPGPRYSGLLTTGGVIPGGVVSEDSTGTGAGGYEMIFGRRAFFGHALAPDGAVWWFVNLPHQDEPARGELEAVTEAQWRERLALALADDAGPALQMMASTEELAPMTPIHTVPPLRRWHAGRCIILGDAAHAPSPTSGQGASLAVEDAVVLARTLRDEPDLDAALARYEALRRPRVEKIVRAAARINNSKAPGPVGRVVRDAVLPAVLRLTARSAANREVYDHHLEWSPTAGSREAPR